MPLTLPPSLEPYRARLEALAAPCLLFSLEEVEDPATPGSRYGGLPLVPPGTAWPRSPRRPMVFLGQLDFAQLARCHGGALAHLPAEGVLSLFYDEQEQRWGSSPEDRKWWQAVWAPRAEQVVALDMPEELAESGLAFERPVRLLARLGVSLPRGESWGEGPVPGLEELPRPQVASYEALRQRLVGPRPHQVGGHASWVQNDARLEAQLVSQGMDCSQPGAWGSEQARRLGRGAAEWGLLWQIPSDEQVGFQWGDAGSLYLLARSKDIRAGRFEQAWLGLQCM